jgi:two-component system sensor histidine kinase DegS
LDYRVDAIDQVIRNAIEVMDSSKYQIYEIGEGARNESDALMRELEQIKQEILQTIDKVDQLENDFRLARVRLSEVSRDFKRFTERDIRHAYEVATKIQLEITVFREKEANLRSRRDELQKRIRNVERTIERAETVISQINVVREYLSGDLNQVTRILESARNRQLLGLKIIHAQEEERRRIAREIHDGMAQSLANVILRTEIAERMVGTQQDELIKAELGDLKRQVRLSLEEVRKMIFNLRPMALDDLGFIPALRKYAQDFEEKYKIRTRFELTGKELRLPSAMEAGIYRIVQEAFTNIYKHAHASFVLLDVTVLPEELRILIEDNGTGFSPSDLERKSGAEGERLGIVGMRERIELLEGDFQIESRPNEGTRITIRVPIKAE